MAGRQTVGARVIDMAGKPEAFFSRWLRLKQEAEPDRPIEPSIAAAAVPADDISEKAAPSEAEVEEVVAALPDIDSLTADSDFAAFLDERVPEALRQKALRRLWRLNPLLANVDGLNDYDDDFTDAATVVEGLKTIYQVGRGMVGEEPPPDNTQEQEAVEAEAPAATLPDEESLSQPREKAALSWPEDEGADQSLPVDATAERDPQMVGEPRSSENEAPQSVKTASRRSAQHRRWGD